MKKLFLFMSWVMLILSGCADEDIIERNSPSFPQSVNTRSAGDGVYDILGYGYDITGPYLDTKSSRAIVFDTNKLLTRVRDNILKSKEQKNIQPTKGGHKMVTCQNYVSLFYRQITSCPSDGGIS